MSAIAGRLVAAPRLLARLEAVQPRYVLSAFIAGEWLVTLAVALTVRHNGWVYYQGGDQLWHYTTAWVMGQGRLSHTSIGFGWSMVLLPFAIIGGPNLVSPLPFIVLFDVLVLMPIALLATYGIGRRMGGRLFGYWAALLWIVVPLLGIKYTLTGYHQRYTELLLPQALGLSVMSDFPSLVVSVVAAYFTVRAVQENTSWDGLFAGLFAGIAIGIKPSNAPLIIGIGLALLWARRGRSLAYFVAGLSPCVLALAVWKGVGEGQLPIFRSGAPGAHAAPVLAISLNIHRYIHPSWSFFSTQLHDLGQYFWSVRLLEWLAIGGTVGLLRYSRPIGLLFGGWFFSTIFVKWTSPAHGTVATSDLLRQSIAMIPAALMILAGVVLLVPGVAKRLRAAPQTASWGTHRVRVGLAAGLVTLFGAVPIALAASLPVLKQTDTISYYYQPGSLSPPFGVDKGWRPTFTRHGGTIDLRWPAQRPLGGTMDYVVFRAPAKDPIYCDVTGGGAQCRFIGEEVVATRKTSFVDHVSVGAWDYRVAAVASWINDPTAGDIYVVAPPVDIIVPR